MQPRWLSLFEAGANVVAGLVLSFLLQLVLFQAMGIIASLTQNIVLTAAFSGLSLIRGYMLRRLFSRFGPDVNAAFRPCRTGSRP